MDARRSPGRVLSHHLEDQIPNRIGNTPPPCRLSDPGDPAPLETKARTVPSNHCLWRDHNQSFFPGGPEAMGSDPKQFVENIQPWPRTPTLQKSKLLPEREVLQEKIPTVTKDANKCTEAEKKQIDHGPELYQKQGETRQ